MLQTPTINQPAQKKRIMWVDIAKAIAIFAMIEGHTAPYNGPLRNFIYSFHMPLFFILTGFTSKLVKTWEDFFKALKKDFLRILVPCIGIQALNGFLSFIINHENAMDALALRIDQLLWGSAFDIYGHSCVGMIWFLIALFWSKTLFNLIMLIFPSKYNGSIFLMLAFLGKYLSDKELYLPQSLDVCLVAVLFIWLGYAFKQVYPVFEKYQMPIIMIAFCIWIFCWEKEIHIDLGGRWYPDFIAGILGAISGCLCIITFSQALESCSPIAKLLAFIGKNTLTILCVSFLDWIALSLWCCRGYGFAYVARPSICFAVSFIIIMLRQLFARIKNTKA